MEMDTNEINAGNSLTITPPKEFTANAVHLGTKCLVCGEGVPIDFPSDHVYKICDKCKRAILKMREYMNED